MFAAGLALVLVPITLGVSLVASTIANYHAPLYSVVMTGVGWSVD